jgi:hypothetical protein
MVVKLQRLLVYLVFHLRCNAIVTAHHIRVTLAVSFESAEQSGFTMGL